MKFTLLFLILVCVTSFGKPKVIVTTSVGSHPESVTGSTDFIFVSNMGPKADLGLSGDGYISKLSKAGELLDAKFLPADTSSSSRLNSPTGMQVVGDTLFVNDVSRILGFSLSSRRLIAEWDLSEFGVTFLNDMTSIRQRYLAVTATEQKAIFILDTQTEKAIQLKVSEPLAFVNGIAFDEKTTYLYLNQNLAATIGKDDENGEVLALQFVGSMRSAKVVWKRKGAGKFLDGLSLLGDGSLLLSDWGGWGNDGNFRRVFPALSSPIKSLPVGLKGMADFYYDPSSRRIYVPQLTEGLVTAFQF